VRLLKMGSEGMFAGLRGRRIEGEGALINLRLGGSGPPLLLLHGYPQSHVMWHRVAPALAERFTVVCPDLRGYGDSAKPPSDAAHEVYCKRANARDMVRVMERLGIARCMLAGHDRGGRVAHRLALDHPERLERLAVLDIVPTRAVFAATNRAIALGYYHWFFLAQPDYEEKQPETLLRTEMDAGPAKVRRRFTAAPRPLRVMLRMTSAQVGLFEGFVREELMDGALPFAWAHPRTQEPAMLRLTAPYVPAVRSSTPSSPSTTRAS
jgi:pimeloyl-ACP methyl ester carboxylesterase